MYCANSSSIHAQFRLPSVNAAMADEIVAWGVQHLEEIEKSIGVSLFFPFFIEEGIPDVRSAMCPRPRCGRRAAAIVATAPRSPASAAAGCVDGLPR